MWKTTLIALAALNLSACATLPQGPSAMVYPAQGKPLEVFHADDQFCRQYAQGNVGMTQDGAMLESGVKTAAIGAVLGTVAGAIIGAATGVPGIGAGIGAGSGLALGGIGGVRASETTGDTVQQRYNMAYLACHYAKGNQVPGGPQ